MKDVVFIVVDSLMGNHVFTKNSGLSLTPFLDSIKDRCLFFSNVFSQGPFTEAGTKGLLTGSGTLDDGGYLFRYDSSKTFLTNVFKERGFDTYSIIYPTCLYSNWILDKLDGIYYTSGMIFDVFWEQKFKHYYKLYEENQFDKKDLEDCIRLTEVIFTAWMHFLDPSKAKEKSLLSEFDSDYDYEDNYKIIYKQYREFYNNPKGYIITLFSKGDNHILNKIHSDFIPNIICNNSIQKAFSKHKRFKKKLYRKQFILNLKNNRMKVSQLYDMFSRIPKGINKYTFGEFLYMITNMLRGKDLETYTNGHNYKLLLSAHSQLNKVGDILEEEHNTPRFVTAHIEEPHYCTTFFSFDSNDSTLISKELDYAEEYIDSLDDSFKGLISYDLSIRYIDKEIQALFKRLNAINKLDNTTVIITADHGSSYNIYPPRGRTVNNCHTENYHIPFIIFDSDIKGRTINHIATNKDIIPTLLDFMKLSKSLDMTGCSLLDSMPPHKYVTTEYMGSGCPDMRRSLANITVRSNRYLVACETLLTNDFSEEDIIGIFDLQRDPLELNNILKCRNSEIEDMILFLKERISSIKENNKSWISYKGVYLKH